MPGCTKPAEDLHHRHYGNAPHELLGDFLYLCRKHHNMVHLPKPAANDNTQLDLFKTG